VPGRRLDDEVGGNAGQEELGGAEDVQALLQRGADERVDTALVDDWFTVDRRRLGHELGIR
jgi:hypothetical protein